DQQEHHPQRGGRRGSGPRDRSPVDRGRPTQPCRHPVRLAWPSCGRHDQGTPPSPRSDRRRLLRG
ncbi:MAG: hypothetical protein AVDCRST_MAG33-3197, partial [uncultured Thermomicrobiales bacterium]